MLFRSAGFVMAYSLLLLTVRRCGLKVCPGCRDYNKINQRNGIRYWLFQHREQKHQQK